VSDSFDIGPLTWVKDDINQSLDSVLESVEALNTNPDDTSGLRFSQTHLYQASGALDMVGLEGCKLFCSQLEKLSAKLEKKELQVTPEVIEAFVKAIRTLKYYIQELLNGSSDIPLRLFPVLKPIMQAMDESIEASELFFPDTSNSVPKEIVSREFSDEEYAKFLVQQRSHYQKSLLKWMQTKDDDALENMYDALSNVTSAQHKPSIKTLWWTASAFAKTLALPEIADDTAAKKLCRKIDQELKHLADGGSKPNNNLLRDLLYYVAISDLENGTVLKVKEVFSLDSLIDKQKSVHVNKAPSGESELNLVEDLKLVLEALRDIWEDVSNSIDFNKIDVNADHALVDLDNVLITKFADKLGENQALINQLSQSVVADSFTALLGASVVLRDDKSKATQVALIEVATALHQLDSALTHYQNLDSDTIQHLHSEIKRLDAIATGLHDGKLESHRIGGLDRDTITAVVKDINASLKVVEQSLDTYFRNPNDKATLSLAPVPLKQIAAIFDMLDLPTPMQIVKACSHFIQYFQQDDYLENQADFELIAESLSMIGLYTNEMPNVRSESTTALEGALGRLNTALDLTGIDFANDELVESVVAASSPVKNQPAGSITEHQKNTKHSDAPLRSSQVGSSIVDRAFDEELLDIYLTEAEEVIGQIAQNLQALRVNATENEPLVEVRRSYHTLKGSGRTVGLVGQAEVAAAVEVFLNGVLDKKDILNTPQITKLEGITAAFASWAAELRANNEAAVHQDYWLAQVEGLSNIEDAQQETTATPEKEPEPYVLIGGKQKLSRQLYEIFLNESMLNLSILEQDVAKLTESKTNAPEKKAKHAVHTLASNALAAGFTPMGELCRALENWLDEVAETWDPDFLVLYSNVIKAVAKMWQSASELKMPRAARALIKLLNEATNKASEHKEVTDVIDHVLYEEDVDQNAALTTVEEGSIADDDLEVENSPVHEAYHEPEEAVLLEEASTDSEDDKEQAIDETLDQHDAAESMPNSEPVTISTINTTNKINTIDVDPELLEMFIEEANEILPQIGIELRAWKGKPKNKTHSDALQRSLHTLKGSARMAAQAEIGDIAHELEEFILKVSKKTPTNIDFEAMFIELDKMSSFFDAESEPVVVGTDNSIVEDDEAVHVARATDRKSQFLRMRAEVLDRLINEAGEVSIIRSRIDREMVGFKQSSHDLTDSLVRLRGYLRELEIEAETQMQSRMSILQEANESFDPLEFDRFTRLQELTRMIAESVNDVGTIQGGLLGNLDQTEAALQQQNRMNRDLQQGLLGVRMLPFQQISERMQRIVRQTARELKKSADLVIDGESTEIDRSVLDRIGAPLEHLLRNAVAHGIEDKSIRKSTGKAEAGKIHVNVRTLNDEIHIIVSDDGAGVNLEKVKQKAIANQLLVESENITEDALLSVIFEPGFSTADDVSQIAGRGVGLDVVRNDISGLGGRIDMSTEAGKGSTFNIYLPITQSVAQVLLVKAGDDTYALPVAMIEQAQKIKRNDLVAAYAEGKVHWNNVNYPLYHLAKLLDHQDHQIEDLAYASVLLLRSGVHTVALHIDEVIGNQEVVMKEIGTQLARVPGIVGATVTGDGSIVLIMNPVQIANRGILSVGGVTVKNVKSKAKKVVNKPRALVVDDSLTMRKVLGRLLEREGYEVLVAKDGMDAMELLQISVPDIILTDIEMPRMDGFGLSRNIRDDVRLANTPLIMISSRTADKHQNLAKEIGVDAFFGKPVQDEELIEKMKALLKAK
jgi:chemosensory pili system protein ChpA (sensor histidine kinase/response regulator)